MAEQRRQKRRHLIYYLEVFDRKSKRQIGHLADLTQEGILLLTQKELAPGDKLDLDIRLPEVPGLKSESLLVKATVRWTGLDKNPALRCVGCQLAPLDSKDQAVIDLLFKLVGFEDV
jgi:hypothetical protein